MKIKTMKMFNLFGEIIEEKEEKHVRDPVNCMRAKGLKCKCHHCNSALHGIVWKRKIEKLDKWFSDLNETVRTLEVMVHD